MPVQFLTYNGSSIHSLEKMNHLSVFHRPDMGGVGLPVAKLAYAFLTKSIFVIMMLFNN
jgi:hypothetical protein